MSVSLPRTGIEYPDSDGEPMAENTVQYRWIVTIKENLEALFLDRPDVFVAADLFWYPVEGDRDTRTAPDVLVALGRPKGDRGSYRQWEEGDVPPRVVFEILSPGNRPGEMLTKREFYQRHGVGEYYVYDPDDARLEAWIRDGDRLRPVERVDGFESPALGIRFDLSGPELVLRNPDGTPFRTVAEVVAERDELERQRDDLGRQNDDLQRELDADRRKLDAMIATLRSLGIDPPD